MIDFKNASFLKLKPVPNSDFSGLIQPMFVPGEEIMQSFRGIRDGVVFTNKRIFAINVQGITGKKKDFTSLPYSKIQLSPWKRPVPSIWTASWSCGSPAWALLNLNLFPMPMSPASAV